MFLCRYIYFQLCLKIVKYSKIINTLTVIQFLMIIYSIGIMDLYLVLFQKNTCSFKKKKMFLIFYDQIFLNKKIINNK